MLCIHHIFLVPWHFHYPKKKPILIKHLVPVLPLPQSLVTTYLLAAPVDLLFWIRCINGTLQFVTLCAWLPSVSMFSRFICAVACFITSFLFLWLNQMTFLRAWKSAYTIWHRLVRKGWFLKSSGLAWIYILGLKDLWKLTFQWLGFPLRKMVIIILASWSCGHYQ